MIGILHPHFFLFFKGLHKKCSWPVWPDFCVYIRAAKPISKTSYFLDLDARKDQLPIKISKNRYSISIEKWEKHESIF